MKTAILIFFVSTTSLASFDCKLKSANSFSLSSGSFSTKTWVDDLPSNKILPLFADEDHIIINDSGKKPMLFFISHEVVLKSDGLALKDDKNAPIVKSSLKKISDLTYFSESKKTIYKIYPATKENPITMFSLVMDVPAASSVKNIGYTCTEEK